MPKNFSYFHLDTVESTQVEALRLWQEKGFELCVSAKEQTAGRGRMQRPWSSLEGNLSFSLALTPSMEMLYSLGFLASLSIMRSIQRFMKKSDTSIVLKWPNDVLLDGAKCAGILIEYHQQPRESLVLGIGCLLYTSPSPRDS